MPSPCHPRRPASHQSHQVCDGSRFSPKCRSPRSQVPSRDAPYISQIADVSQSSFTACSRSLSCSHALNLRSLSSQALHTPPPNTRVWRLQPSATTISPLTSAPSGMFLVYERRRGTTSRSGSKDSDDAPISGDGGPGSGSGSVKAVCACPCPGAGRGIRAFAAGADTVSASPIGGDGLGRGFSDLLTCSGRWGWGARFLLLMTTPTQRKRTAPSRI
jgi:hypothetical protein